MGWGGIQGPASNLSTSVRSHRISGELHTSLKLTFLICKMDIITIHLNYSDSETPVSEVIVVSDSVTRHSNKRAEHGLGNLV